MMKISKNDGQSDGGRKNSKNNVDITFHKFSTQIVEKLNIIINMMGRWYECGRNETRK